MSRQVVYGQWLLDEEQAEGIQPTELDRVRQRVSGVAVDLEGQVSAETLPDGADRGKVPAGLEFST